ncbi:MAG TPA: response regulator [Candidatus Saccharimonadales bacterium]|nr:response regulator [Candidatus Saccharimonadales bacterium]
MSKEHPTVMIVEDETLLLQAITKKLKLSGIDVLSCSSGQQAIDYLKSLEELPDAVWLDYYLKDMNGLAFMEALKQDPKWSGIPVIVVSNSASPDKVNNMLALGAKKYLLKAEYRLDEIIGIIHKFIQEDGEPDLPNPLITPGPDVVHVPSSLGTPAATPPAPVVDPSASSIAPTQPAVPVATPEPTASAAIPTSPMPSALTSAPQSSVPVTPPPAAPNPQPSATPTLDPVTMPAPSPTTEDQPTTATPSAGDGTPN